jgi:transposase
MSAPGVGPIVALTFQAVVDDPRRFGGDARRLTAYLGPDRPGASRLEHLATTRRSAAPLRTWVQALAARRGRRIAIVALARRLARVLFAMWRDQRAFTAEACLPGTTVA